MSRDEKIAYLKSFNVINRRIERECEELAVWRSRATKVTPALSDASKGRADGDRIQSAVEKICALEEKINADIDLLLFARESVKSVIALVPDPKQREVLERRYIHGQTWEQIAEQACYSERHIRRLHRDALKHVLECPL